MKNRLVRKLPVTQLTSRPISTYSQRTFNSAVGYRSPVQSQLFGFSAVGTIPGGIAQGSAPVQPFNSYFQYINGATYFEVINGEEYYITT